MQGGCAGAAPQKDGRSLTFTFTFAFHVCRDLPALAGPCYTRVTYAVHARSPSDRQRSPADATSKSHVFLLRSGYVRRVGAGVYSFLPREDEGESKLR